ncbi:MAG: ABC transporter ATP-binding protein [Planctomycetaceae bacterium]
MNSPNSDLFIAGLTKAYSGAEGPVPVLKGIDLSINRGESLAITGPSGSGKSTLLQILGTLDRPSEGTFTLLGESPFSLNDVALARFRNRQIGFIFQDHHLLPQCTVVENVLIPALAGPGTDQPTEARAKQLLDRVGLSHRLMHRPAQLSGGERQRVAVCRALINQPVLVLADEPTGNLDRVHAQTVGKLLLELCRENNSILMCVTHSAELAEQFPRRSELRDGKLVDL